MDAGDFRLFNDVAERSNLRNQRVQRGPSVPEARHARLRSGLQGKIIIREIVNDITAKIE